MNEEIQNKTTDKGWVAMQELLDREMPVEQKRRRFFWWWLALLLLPMAAYGGWRLWDTPAQKPAPVKKTALPTETPFAAAAPHKPEISPEKTRQAAAGPEGTASSFAAVRSTAAPTSMPAPLVTSVNYGRTQEAPPLSAGGNMILSNAEIRAVQIKTGMNADATPIKSPRTTNFEPLPFETQLIENHIATINKTPATVGALPGETPIQPQKKSGHWSTGVTASVATDHFSSINNVGGGLAFHWRYAPRWGVRTGLLYNQYNPSTASQLTATVQPSAYEKAAENSGFIVTDGWGNSLSPATGADSLQENVIIPVSKLQIAEVPLLASWQMARPITLLAGLNMSYVLGAKSGNKSFSGDFTLQLNSDAAAQNLNSLVTDEIQRLRFDVQTGIAIDLTKRVELGLFVKIPVNTSPATTNEKRYGAFEEFNNNKARNSRVPSYSLSATCFF